MNNEKYVSVSNLENAIKDLCASQTSHQIHKLIVKSKPMIAVEDIEKVLKQYENNNLLLPLVIDIRKLITSQPEKHCGLTTKQWEQLRKHPYIRVDHEFCDGVFLHQYNDVDKILKLLPDSKRMTRTDLDLPDGIEIEITETDSSKGLFVTPIANTNMAFKHYRILGVAEDE